MTERRKTKRDHRKSSAAISITSDQVFPLNCPVTRGLLLQKQLPPAHIKAQKVTPAEMSTKSRDESPDDDKDIPDDFFNDLADSKYLDELLSNQVDADSQGEFNNERTATEAAAAKMDVESTQSPNSGDDNESPASPLMERCLREIDKLTKDIQKKKKKLQKELQEKEREKRDRSESPVGLSPVDKHRRRNRSRSSERYGRRRKSRSPRRRSRSRDRRRSRSRSRNRASRYARNRTSGSPAKPAMTFLEELDKKFAEQGQAFPEKDLMLKMQAHGNEVGMPGPSSAHRMNIPFGVAQPMRYPVPVVPSQPMEMFPPGIGPVYATAGLMPDPPMFRYQAPVFGPNPMAMRLGGFGPVAPPYPEQPQQQPPPIHMMQPAEARPQTLTEVNQVMQVCVLFRKRKVDIFFFAKILFRVFFSKCRHFVSKY